MVNTQNEKSTSPRENEVLNDSTDRWTHAKYREYLVSRIKEYEYLLNGVRTISERVAVLSAVDTLTDRLYQLDIKTRRVKFVIDGKEF